MATTENIIETAGSTPEDRLRRAVDKWLQANAATLHEWRVRSRGRRALLGLDDHELADIGIGRSEATEEAAKPFWKP